jgi:dCMP deaminase
MSWDDRFIRLAQEFASWSKDPSTKVGAVIVDHDRRVIGSGYNGFPRGVDDGQNRYSDKPTKYKLIVHAEANAILNAVSSVRGMTMYTTKYPCSECTKLVIQAGLYMVVTPPPGAGEPWATDAEFSKAMMKEALVLVREPNQHWSSK